MVIGWKPIFIWSFYSNYTAWFHVSDSSLISNVLSIFLLWLQHTEPIFTSTLNSESKRKISWTASQLWNKLSPVTPSFDFFEMVWNRAFLKEPSTGKLSTNFLKYINYWTVAIFQSCKQCVRLSKLNIFIWAGITHISYT